MTQPEYAMVTVKLETAELSLPANKMMEAVKSKLGIASPEIDETYGAIPMSSVHGCVVLIEEKLAFKMQEDGNPNILRVFSDPKFEPFNAPNTRKKGGPSGPFGPF